MEPVTQTRVCTKCRRRLPLSRFNTDNAKPDKRYPTCKVCRKIQRRRDYENALVHNPDSVQWRRLIKYGITKEEYLVMYREQAGACAICFYPEPPSYVPTLNVDHDHTTGKLRELLCRNCNTALGMVQDDIETLESMINYLKKHQ